MCSEGRKKKKVCWQQGECETGPGGVGVGDGVVCGGGGGQQAAY